MAYYIGDRINKPAPHHESIQALWETKWKFPVSHWRKRRSHSIAQSFQVQNRSLPLYGRQARRFWTRLQPIDRVGHPPSLRFRCLRKSLLPRCRSPCSQSPRGRKLLRPLTSLRSLPPRRSPLPHRTLPNTSIPKAERSLETQQRNLRRRRKDAPR